MLFAHIPTGQVVPQEDDPLLEKVPDEHGWQTEDDVAPDTLEYIPAAQAVQVRGLLELKVPGEHWLIKIRPPQLTPRDTGLALGLVLGIIPIPMPMPLFCWLIPPQLALLPEPHCDV